MTGSPGPAQPPAGPLGLVWGTCLSVIKYFDYQTWTGLLWGARAMLWKGHSLWRSPQECPTSSGSERKPACHPGGTWKQGEEGRMISTRKAFWELSLYRVSASRDRGKGVPGSENHFRQPGPTDGTSWATSCWCPLSSMTHRFHQLLITSFPSEALIVIYTPLAEFL